ncbi:MAG: bifunctional metallophosphatase/5'-nucleotidase, partial [Desulfomonilaceae bacterium]
MLMSSRWKIHKSLVVLFTSVALFALSSNISWSKDLSCSFKLTILYMNDTHGHYSSEQLKDGSHTGGFAKAATLMEKIRKANESEGRMTLTLLAGDLFTGTAYSAVFKGAFGVKLMNAMGFTAMTVGNHEFDYGLDHLIRKLRPEMKFPLLSANITYKNGMPVFKPYIIKKIPDTKCKILILGLTTVNTPELTHPRNVKNLVFEDPVNVARDIAQKIGNGKFVIALTHLGIDKDKKLAILCPGIDVIIGGHSHTSVPEPLKLDKTLVCQAGAYSRFLGKLDVDVKDGQIQTYRGELINLDENVPEDPNVTTIIQDYKRQMSPFFAEVIGSTRISLAGSLSDVRSSTPNPLGG